MTSTRTALIAGAGIAGPVAAIALQRAGIAATVYEAHDTTASGIGAFLTVATNGLDALRVLDADRAVLAAGFPTPGITLRSGSGRRLGETSTTGTLPGGQTSRTIKRADLYEALHDEASERGVRVEYGRRLVAATQADDGVHAVFADGSEASADVLICCDGVHSTVRGIIDPAAPHPSYCGLVTTGGYARGVRVDAEPGRYEMVFGARGFFGYAVAPGDEVWWFANLPRADEPGRGELAAIDPTGWREQVAALFADDAGPACELIAATPELMAPSAIHAMPHLPTWRSGRMLVMGDAAHAPSPTSGQGASLSIEDAVVLAICLRDAPHPEQAFARFEAQRRPRVERIVKWAARINNSKAAGPVARRFRDALLPVILKLTAGGKGHAQTYDHRIDWSTPAAAAP